MKMARPAFALLLALLAGCAVPRGAPVEPPMQLPADWDDGVALHTFSADARHSGAFGAEMENATLDRPAACRAYRTDMAVAQDTCVVRDPDEYETSTRLYPSRQGTWVIEADWAGCPGGDFNGCHDEPRPEHGLRRVVAFDAAGIPVAFWDGVLSPGTRFATE